MNNLLGMKITKGHGEENGSESTEEIKMRTHSTP